MKTKTTNLYLKLPLLLILLFFADVAMAQGRLFLEEVNGQPIKMRQYEEISGSPYLQDEWKKGVVRVANNKVYEGLEIKYDQVEDLLLFKDEHGQALRFVEPVEQFIIPVGNSSKTFRNGFTPAKGATQNSYFEILTEGNATLLKKTNKIIREEKTYNSATKVKSIQPLVTYYIVKDGVPIRIKNDAASLVKALVDKKEMLEAYIRVNKLKTKEDKDLIQLVAYYNAL